MDMNAWRSRLEAAIESSGKSKRAISLASGAGPGYVHSILKEGKVPTIENLMSICEAIPVSLAYILYGFDITHEDAELLAALKESPETRAAMLTLIRRPQPDGQTE